MREIRTVSRLLNGFCNFVVSGLSSSEKKKVEYVANLNTVMILKFFFVFDGLGCVA